MAFPLLAAGASLLGGIISGRSQASAANRATDAQVTANRENIDFQQGIYDDQTALFDPYRDAGQAGLGSYMQTLGFRENPLGGGWNAGTSTDFPNTPGYQYQVQEGQRAIEGAAASQGGLHSGATLRALQGHRQGLADQTYQSHQNRLAGVAGMGQSAAAQQGAAAGNLGQSVGGSMMNIGNAQSAGAIANGNAVANGINQGFSTFGYLNQMGIGQGGLNVGGQNSLFSGNSWG